MLLEVVVFYMSLSKADYKQSQLQAYGSSQGLLDAQCLMQSGRLVNGVATGVVV